MGRDRDEEVEGSEGAESSPAEELAAGGLPVVQPPSVGAGPTTGAHRSDEPPFTHTRASGLWATVVVALVLLLALAVFILENGRHVKVSYLGAHGTLPLGIALLLAAIFGGLVVVFAGTARILQLRRRSRSQRRALSGATRRSRRGGGHGGEG